MFPEGLCANMGIAGWLIVIGFWGVFLGLTVWVVTRLFPRATTRTARRDDLAELDSHLAAGDLDADS